MTIEEFRRGLLAPPRGNELAGYLAYEIGPVKVAQQAWATRKRKLGALGAPSRLKEAGGVALPHGFQFSTAHANCQLGG